MLYPLNRYLTVDPIEEVRKQSGILVPDGIDVDNSTYKLLRIIEPHFDSKLKKGLKVVAPSHLVEEVSFFGEMHYLVLENHVVAFYED